MWLQRVGACLVALLALADFFRWRAVDLKWISFGRIVPMAPGTEGVFVAVGVAIALHLFQPARRGARLIMFVLSAGAAAIALHVLLSHFSGRSPAWESWFIHGDLVVEGFSVGHMSTQSAGLSLLSIFALLALYSPLAGRAAWRDAGIFAALLVELFALVTVVSYAAGNPPIASNGWLKAAPLVMFEPLTEVSSWFTNCPAALTAVTW